jgi:hypothetical protein
MFPPPGAAPFFGLAMLRHRRRCGCENQSLELFGLRSISANQVQQRLMFGILSPAAQECSNIGIGHLAA